MSEQNPELTDDERAELEAAGQQTGIGDYAPRRRRPRRTETAESAETTDAAASAEADQAEEASSDEDETPQPSYGGNYIDFAKQEPVRDRGDLQPAQYSWGDDETKNA